MEAEAVKVGRPRDSVLRVMTALDFSKTGSGSSFGEMGRKEKGLSLHLEKITLASYGKQTY